MVMFLSFSLLFGYLVLIGLTAGYRRRSAGTRWLLPFLASAVLVSTVFGLSRQAILQGMGWHSGLILAVLYLFQISLLGVLTFEFIQWKRSWIWLTLGGGAILAALMGAYSEPPPGLLGQSWRYSLLISPPSVAGLVAAAFWTLGAFFQLLLTSISIRRGKLPLQANRSRFWALALPIHLLGAGLAAWGREALTIPGEGLQLAGAVGFTYAVLRPRLADVRSLTRQVLRQVFLVLLTAALLLLTVRTSRSFGSADLFEPQWWGVLAGLALVVAVGYELVRGLVEWAAGPNRSASRALPEVVRAFGGRTLRLVQVDELARAAGQSFADVFGASRSVLLVLSRWDDRLQVNPVPGHGLFASSPTEFGANNPVIQVLALRDQPLLQYDIDVESQYQGMPLTERRWLRSLAADIYVPVRDGDVLQAVFAIGPKVTGEPYRPDELEALMAMANQSALALKSFKLLDDQKALREELDSLGRDLQATNAALAKMDGVRTDFIAIASHELRTPLTQVRGYVDVLGTLAERDQLDPERVKEAVNSLRRAADRLDAVYGQMLDASQIDVDAFELKLTETTLEAVLRMAVEPLAESIRARRQTLAVHGVRALPPLRADPQRLVQAFGQVIGNAVKFTPDGGRIDVGARLMESELGQPPSAEVVVADTGIGIDPAYHEMIFRKFFRLGNVALHSTGATKFLGAGPGLGLPIAKGIVERHGGRIWVESAGQNLKECPGSKFHVVLPITPPAFRTSNGPFVEDGPAANGA